MVELSVPALEESSYRRTLFVDRSSNLRRSEVGIVLQGPSDLVLEYYLCFSLQTRNDQAGYEALIA